MKPLLLCTAALACALSLGAREPRVAAPAHDCAWTSSALRVDEPPPEPIDCPFCGGDGTLHRRRMIVLETRSLTALLRVLPR